MSLLRAAWVIARRDFTASVYSHSFLFFLFAPLIILSISILFGNVTQRAAKEDVRVTVAVIGDPATYRAIDEARSRIAPAIGGEQIFPNLLAAPPQGDVEAQARKLLGSSDKKIVAVLAGGLDLPRMIGPVTPEGSVVRQMQLILDQARQERAIAHSGTQLAPVDIKLVRVSQSAGVLATAHAMTARAGQLLLFMLTVLLAGMLLSNMIEEKSNKVIEVLAAAVPVDAIFLGKIFAMLAVSLVGIAVWTLGGTLALMIWAGGAGGVGIPEPAVGWPLFILFVLIYFSANYLLLGALFLGIGSQASSVREVQTMSMPVTVGQMLIFLLASVAMSQFNAPLGIGAAIFPFSSPLMMVARAAQTPELWPHLLALIWQAIWVSITVSLGAAMFRRNVLKSGAGGMKRRWRRRGA